MNPGFMSIWIIIILLILMVTGWKPYLAPEVSRRSLLVTAFGITVLLPFSLWWQPMPNLIPIELHAAVIVLLFSGLLTLKGSEDWRYKGYLVLCAVMIAVIWGSLRKMYSFYPIFYWLDPQWDAPLFAGVLCSAFTSQVKHQFGIIVWAAALGEVLNALLQSGNYTAMIGTLTWWDSFWITLITARIFSFVLKAIRRTASRVGVMLWDLKGGRSS